MDHPWQGLIGRRDLLRVGSLGLAATFWPGEIKAENHKEVRAESVIVLWMAGGVTHIDGLDPKPDAPEQVRGTLGTIATKLPGVRFTECMPCLARMADRIALVRSYSHDNNDHFQSQAFALSGRKVTPEQIMTEPNIGSIVSYLQGPRAGLPGYIAVPGGTRPGPPPHNLFGAGWLGQAYGPFAVGGTPKELDFAAAFGARIGRPEPLTFDEDLSPAELALPPGLNSSRLSRRAGLRQRLDDARRQASSTEMDGHYRAAFGLLDSPRVQAAFDMDRVDPKQRDHYGRTKIGKRCLLAARLVEAGARFVMVDYGYDPDYGNLWDNHGVAVQRQPHISEIARRPYHLAGMDRAFAALIADLEGRGLLDRTLVVFLTEFGRTPRINAGGGRDHWGAAGSIFLAGGGVRGGQVIGGTDKQGAYPTSRPWSPADVAATIYQAIGIDPSTLLHDRQGRPLAVLPQGEPIEGVF